MILPEDKVCPEWARTAILIFSQFVIRPPMDFSTLDGLLFQ
jgi:hypothetical protein